MSEATVISNGETLTEGKPEAPSTPASRKPTSRASRSAAQAKADASANGKAPSKPATKTSAAKPAPKQTAAQKKAEAAKKAAADAKKAEAAATKDFHEMRRELFRKVIISAGELVQEYPKEHRADLAIAISRQLHHLTNKKAGWPKGKLPVPDRSDWR